MKKHPFSIFAAFLLCFSLTASLAFGDGPGRLYGKENPFTAEELPSGELKTKLQQLDGPAKEKAMQWLRRMTFHEFDAAQHLRVDNEGGIYIVCPGDKSCTANGCTDAVHSHPAATATTAQMPLPDTTANQTTLSTDPIISKLPVPNATPPAYNSKPGAPYTIYLDFNGAKVKGTAWNTSSTQVFDCYPYNTEAVDKDDPDKAYETFSDIEQRAMFDVWQRMAEDYAPFNVNVTTDVQFDPDTYTGDKNKVGWLLFTGTTDRSDEPQKLPHAGTGGIAYVDVFGESNFHSRYQPAWVVPNRADYMSEAAAHEMGHNLGLSHDGRGGDEYYLGHGTGDESWAPIMGAGYNRNMTQWSKGEYSAGTQSQDDLAIIANKLTYRNDDHGDTADSATPLTITGDTDINSTNPETDPENASPENKGIIGSSSDVDVFSFETGDGSVTLNVNPWKNNNQTNGGNLDIVLALYNTDGALVTSSNPLDKTSASITTDLISGTYFLHVKNTGSGNPRLLEPTGYTAYGSLGQYFISGTIQEATPRLRVLSVSPNQGENDAAIQVVITGKLFQADTAVRLKKTGSPDIVGNMVNYVSSEEIHVSFNILNAPIGEWDVFASHTSNLTLLDETDTLEKGFEIILPVLEFFEEDFDDQSTLPAGWKTYSTMGTTPLWGVDSSSSQTPSNSVSAGGPSASGTKYLESPSISIGAAVVDLKLSFWQLCNMEGGYDGGVLEFSINGGEWFDILSIDSGAFFESNGYNKLMSNQYRSPIAGRYAWSGNSNGYVHTVVNLSNVSKYAGNDLRVRWLLATDNAVASTGWNIDTVEFFGSYDPTFYDIKPNDLVVTANNDLSFSGNYGGPFSPSAQSYELKNNANSPLKWSVLNDASWVTLSATSGTLAAGESITVGVSINTNSLALPIGKHTAKLKFQNLALDDDIIRRNVLLAVNGIPANVAIRKKSQTYDGSPKSVRVITDPSDLRVRVTYDGSTTPPTNPGSYKVVAKVKDAFYVGSATSTLVINKIIPTVTEWPEAREIPLGRRVAAATLSGGKASVRGSFSYDSPREVLVVGTHRVRVTFTPKNATIYATVSGKVKVTVYPKSPDLVHTTVRNVTNSGWKVVNLGKTYSSPVIVATPIYSNSKLPPVVTRIRNVTSSSFELRLDRIDGSKDPVSMKVAVVAVNEGVYTEERQGIKMEAVKFKSRITASGPKSWVAESRKYQNTYNKPVVVGQVMSYNDRKWSVFWSMGESRTNPVDATNLNLGKHVGLSRATNRSNETIGYIVIEAGRGKMNGIRYRAGVGDDIVQSFKDSVKPFKYSFARLPSVSTAAVSQTGMDGKEGSWAVLAGKRPLTRSALKLYIAEDALKNSSREHTTEQAAYIVFE